MLKGLNNKLFYYSNQEIKYSLLKGVKSCKVFRNRTVLGDKI